MRSPHILPIVLVAAHYILSQIPARRVGYSPSQSTLNTKYASAWFHPSSILRFRFKNASNIVSINALSWTRLDAELEVCIAVLDDLTFDKFDIATRNFGSSVLEVDNRLLLAKFASIRKTDYAPLGLPTFVRKQRRRLLCKAAQDRINEMQHKLFILDKYKPLQGGIISIPAAVMLKSLQRPVGQMAQETQIADHTKGWKMLYCVRRHS